MCQHFISFHSLIFHCETPLVLQWLRLCALKAGGLVLILGQRARSHMLQLRPDTAKQINNKEMF